MYSYITYLISLLLLISCTASNINIITPLPKNLKEISAIEITDASKTLWMIEDSGNKNILYGLNLKGNIIKQITLSGVKNIDWEDLTSDSQGNIYIGDFGNNSSKRKKFFIHKVVTPDVSHTITTPITTIFELPKKHNKKDFEAFFLWNSNFYLFSKEDKTTSIFKVANLPGNQKAQFIGKLNLKGKKNPITSADISSDKKNIVLLNHKKLWSLSNFNEGDFSDSLIQEIDLAHSSQKEGICFKNKNTIYITDEKTNKSTGNVYEFKSFQ